MGGAWGIARSELMRGDLLFVRGGSPAVFDKPNGFHSRAELLERGDRGRGIRFLEVGCIKLGAWLLEARGSGGSIWIFEVHCGSRGGWDPSSRCSKPVVEFTGGTCNRPGIGFS
jgi:hypothetical protein